MVLSFEAIREVHRQEKSSQKLTKLPEGFFEEVGKYLEMKSSKGSALSMLEVENAKMVINDIIDRREHKILEAAMVFARSGIVPENLAPEEQELFEQLSGLLKSYRSSIWERILGRQGEEKQAVEDGEEVSEEEPEDAGSPEESKEAEALEERAELAMPEKEEKPDWSGVYLVLKNLPLFIWSDGKRYELKEGDAVRLPEELSKFLVEKGVLKPMS